MDNKNKKFFDKYLINNKIEFLKDFYNSFFQVLESNKLPNLNIKIC